MSRPAHLPESMYALWNRFENAPDDWCSVEEGHTDDYFGFYLREDGEFMLVVCPYDEDDGPGITEEWYIHANGESCLAADEEEPLAVIADAVADAICANGHSCTYEDIHPLIRDEVARLLREEYEHPGLTGAPSVSSPVADVLTEAEESRIREQLAEAIRLGGPGVGWTDSSVARLLATLDAEREARAKAEQVLDIVSAAAEVHQDRARVHLQMRRQAEQERDEALARLAEVHQLLGVVTDGANAEVLVETLST